ncbi:transcription factor IIIB 90 kDa subunit-like [Panonychus citri]|uniref:transcription factor IIIB 90 kDa subunit-like n=1 Tax=Panonychus citri TaxID=50023 RepID=UPI002307E7A2|nr:transcription factor IIIB 90 kDa subunit-like [Panonychus citri]
MASRQSCPKCGSSDLETDAARGDTVCTNCGSVLEDNLIVSEVQFQEGSHGGSNIIGQTISVDNGFQGLSMGGMMATGKESRQITLDRARKRIKAIGASLSLNNHCMDMAFNFYKMALSKRLTCGRKNNHVIAACIYITCRVECTSHMLLDLSDLMQVNVYELGRTYLKLSGALCLNIPVLDPCLYIVRFAHKLGLEEKTHDVEMTALRLVQRMKRDWMDTGRRPSGLCGAALLVATRLNNIERSVKEVVDIVKVCETTIRKRLNEFSDTPTSKLTLDEFMTVDLEGEEDPPCYKMANRKAKSIVEDKKQLEEAETQVAKIQQQIEEKLDSLRKKFRSPYVTLADIEELAPKRKTVGDEGIEDDYVDVEEVIEKIVEENHFNIIREIVGQDNPQADSFLQQLQTFRPTAASLGIRESLNLGFTNGSDEENGDMINQEDDVDNEYDEDTDIDDEENNSINLPTSEDNQSSSESKESGVLDLEGIDDTELDNYILSSAEIQAKTKLWYSANAEYLKEMEEKEKRKAEEEAERAKKESLGEVQPKKKRKSKKKTPIEANTAGEAIEKMLEERKLSNKINYDVLRRL